MLKKSPFVLINLLCNKLNSFLQIYENFNKINNDSKFKLSINKIIKSKRKNYKEIDGKIEIFKKKILLLYIGQANKTQYLIKFYFRKFVLIVNLLNNLKVEIIRKNKQN